MVSIQLDCNERLGRIKPLHGINNAPLSGTDNQMFHYLGEAGVPYSRLHDTGGRFGGGCFVDIENVFRSFDADPEDPASYDFAFTDWLLAQLHTQGVEPFYRLGTTIETSHRIKAYRIFPPKDNLQWARICEGIIRHYNEGWADGFHYNIRYWEIWNEPDNMPDTVDNAMWKGTKEQYFRLYEVASRYLKERFPHLKIGGYAGCGFYLLGEEGKPDPANWTPRFQYLYDFFLEFLQYISSSEHRSPLDFFSWHHYSDHRIAPVYARFVRETLDRFGFIHTESILDEWSAGTESRGTCKDAALIGAMIGSMQDAPVDQLHYYDGQLHTSYGGLFDPVHKTAFKAYYVLQAFHVLYCLENQISCRCQTGELAKGDLIALAASDGRHSALLLVNPLEQPQMVRIRGIQGKVRCRVIDEVRDFSDAAPPSASGELELSPYAVCLVEWQSEPS